MESDGLHRLKNRFHNSKVLISFRFQVSGGSETPQVLELVPNEALKREAPKEQAPITPQFTNIFQKFVLVNQVNCLVQNLTKSYENKKHQSSIRNYDSFPYFSHGKTGAFLPWNSGLEDGPELRRSSARRHLQSQVADAADQPRLG